MGRYTYPNLENQFSGVSTDVTVTQYRHRLVLVLVTDYHDCYYYTAAIPKKLIFPSLRTNVKYLNEDYKSVQMK